MSILEVNNIKKKFDNTEILKGISFSMEKGETLSILGSSGSGKTTLLRCLNFLETPNEGTITVNDNCLFDAKNGPLRDGDLREKRLHFGMVFQQFNLFPQYTALENVTLAPKLENRGKSQDEIIENGKLFLDKMGLSDRMNNYPHQLSGGQQQRVAIARALALRPDILCFDEPTSALDPELTGEVLKVIKELAEQHTTMIIVTHEIGFARDVSDKIIFMDDGVIADEGTPDQVIDNPSNERTRQFLANYLK
ncbi:amino acid ABC transporter ATP-binding protein [Pseudobutyrivibrio xylanivorans]|uniref:Polar amino acid transport system ATP-binding protein n=1 Tax=Pseudobutyrivibrio xylanivorans DSM 14809 TaxID=1123012 RepID=A0A1M6ABH1_PSEXY|nr:amino acid ABC transporter ATP-binding protein [Pseudobutyrivibrio xylanivorans]SHI33840.1 polar amino acid transport system ATP-binding protein [Pseudobutyrivibrio xylanivorans DSM 14809]